MKFIIALLLVCVVGVAQAQTTEELVSSVKKSFRYNREPNEPPQCDTKEVLVQVNRNNVSILKSSGVPNIDEQALKATRASVSQNFEANIAFLITVTKNKICNSSDQDNFEQWVLKYNAQQQSNQ